MAGFTRTTIQGTAYLIYDNAGKDLLTTGSDGKLNILRLPAGKYYLQEATAPKKYQLSDEKYAFELSEDKTGDAILDLGTIENQFASASIALAGTKNLTGKTLEDDMFSFVVTDEDNTPVATATNKADGSITFSNISFSSAGTYTYTVKEVGGNADGITYDDNEYTVTVIVVENDDETLTATASYPEGGLCLIIAMAEI